MNSGIIILNYHDIKTNADSISDYPFTIDSKKFEEQLTQITSNYILHGLTLKRSNKGQTNSLLLTFDDGYASHYHVVKPLLAKYNIKAIFFPIISKINSKNHLTQSQINELLNDGHTIGLHGLNHRPLTKYNMKKLEEELEESLHQFISLTGTSCNHFSLPFGEYNSRIISSLKTKGIQYIFSTNGYQNEGNNFCLNRINIRINHSKEQFTKMITLDGFTLRLLELKGAINRIKKQLSFSIKKD